MSPSSPQRPFARVLPALAVAAALLWPVQSRAEAPGGALFEFFGNEAKGLLGEGIHFDAEFGLWAASLDGGLSSLLDSYEGLAGDPSAVTKASQSIGTGEGLVRQVGLSVNVKGNRAALNYLSDRLLELGQDEADKRVENPLARSLIEQLVGELRPDLSALEEIDGQLWIRGEYGRFRGEIDKPDAFIARNGKPYFPSKSEPWQTEYFSGEIGLMFEDAPGNGAGFYARYRNFSRPLILGFGTTTEELHLQDGEVTAVELGLRFELMNCETFCWTLEGTFVPFTGVAVLDFGDIGYTSAPVLAMGGNAELSLPISFGGYAYLSPYVGFRTEFLFPVAPSFGLELQGIADSSTTFNISIWNPDYFFWGPTTGVVMSF